MTTTTWDYIQPLNVKEKAKRFEDGEPFRFVVLDNFLRPEFSKEVCRAFPHYAEARSSSDREFRAVNEYGKLQIVDSTKFPEPIKILSDALQSPELLETMIEITSIPNLLADPQLRGAGMHMMESGSRLDVHVDFNHLDERLYRRLNIIVYLNEEWQDGWGGELDIWDPTVKERMHMVPPVANRAVMFNTVPRSFHGVMPVTCPSDRSRNTFAGFYYTKEAPPEWEGKFEGAVWAYRPGEEYRNHLMAKPERLLRNLRRRLRKGKKKLFG